MKQTIITALAALAPVAAAAGNVPALPYETEINGKWHWFCQTEPRQCEPSASKMVGLTPDLLADLNRINRGVNRAPYKGERVDRWQIIYQGMEGGDCEDYALTKRALLIAAGYPAHALRLAVVDGGNKYRRHAVLVVVTDAGDLVLDNERGHIEDAATYSFWSIHAPTQSQPNRWKFTLN